MSRIQDWVAAIPDNQKKKPNQRTVSELFSQMEEELRSLEPDYDGCVLALSAFPHQVTGAFYRDLYQPLPPDVRTPFDAAFLAWAKGKPMVAGSYLGYLRMAQAIKNRLPLVDDAKELLPELHWYISSFNDKRAVTETKKFITECEPESLQKLLALDVRDWHIDGGNLKKFYGILFADCTGPVTQEMYRAFLQRNQLADGALPAAVQPVLRPEDTPDGRAGDPVAEDTPLDGDAHDIPATDAPISGGLASERAFMEPSPEEDGVELAERLLAWSRGQADGMATLRRALRSAEEKYARLDARFSNLTEELTAVKGDLADREAALASLQQDLTETVARLGSSQQRVTELDAIIQKLHRMNDNSASQAVQGYKVELADALKSTIADARLPEVQADADILSSLLGDLLDILRFKDIPLEDA